MQNDSLGDRMKGYEACYNASYPLRFPLILRFDGKSFHTKVKKWKCAKPFDDNLIDAMANTAKYLCENISGSKVAYTQSDEITLLVRNDETLGTQAYFNNEINKILSIGAAKATKAFTHFFFKNNLPDDIEMLPEFDCRGFIVPENEILNAFLWRQQDASKNSIQMLARSLFSHNQLHKLNGNQLQDKMMLEKTVNWNDLPTHKKRGLCVIKKYFLKDRNNPDFEVEVPRQENDNENFYVRGRWVVDYDIPIFSQNRDYINQFARISNGS